MKAVMAMAVGIVFPAALVAAAAVVYFVLPDALAELVTEQFGAAPVDFVRSLMCV